MTPRVSICLPNLNTRPFLEERMETILAQSFADWELIVSDNHSDDGAWEYFQTFAGDPRVKLAQAPRAGLYPNWNECIRRATGEYVYIATSDDTLAPDCLEKMVRALDAHPECDIAHCPLRTYDEHGFPFDAHWEGSVFARSAPELLMRPHVRLAPFDGLLHLLRASVYWSITQLLIRRRLFDRIGLFNPQWGSAGDFHWDMRAGLVANTVHVPDTWGGWRVHAAQATKFSATSSPETRERLQTMIDDAVTISAPQLPPTVARPLQRHWRRYLRDRETLRDALERSSGRGESVALLAASVTRNRQPPFDWARWKCFGSGPWLLSDIDVVNGWMRELDAHAWLVPCD